MNLHIDITCQIMNQLKHNLKKMLQLTIQAMALIFGDSSRQSGFFLALRPLTIQLFNTDTQ